MNRGNLNKQMEIIKENKKKILGLKSSTCEIVTLAGWS